LFSHIPGLLSRFKKRVFKLVRYIPSVQAKIDGEIAKITQDFDNEMSKHGELIGYITELPERGMTREQIVGHVDNYLNLGNYAWKEGKVSGAVYYHDQQLIDLVTEVYGKSSYTNPLHPDIFPGICKMEAEVIRMVCKLFNGGPATCGTMTTGGTESIMMACKAYRDFGLEHRGIDKPNIVMPVTAHTAFDKAAKYLKLFVKTVRVDPNTHQADVKAMERAINRNTVMVSFTLTQVVRLENH
jgi:sphinganine-1-phosphate aldolase